MKTILIRPPRDKNALNLSHFTQSEPLGLEILYNIFQNFFNVEIFDMVFDKRSIDSVIDTDVKIIGISSICNDINSTIKLSKKIKEINENIIIFVGGYQATSTPHYFYTHSIDYIIKWTRKDSIEKFIKNIVEGRVEVIQGILARELNYKYKKSIEKNEILISNRKSTEKYRRYYSYFAYKSIALIDSQMYFEEIEDIKEEKIAFIDYDFLSCQNLNLIVSDLKKRDKRIMVYSSVKSIKESKNFLWIMRQSGVESILIFIDDYNNKDFLSISNYLREANINMWIYLTLYPNYTKEDFINIGKFARKVEAKILTLTPYLPLYESKDYKKYKNRLLYENLNEHYGKVVVNPDKLSLSLYYLQIVKCLFKFYSTKILYFIGTFGLKATLDFYLKGISFVFKVILVLKEEKSKKSKGTFISK